MKTLKSLLAVCMVASTLSLAACGGDKKASDPTPTPTASAAAETTTPESAKPTEAPKEEKKDEAKKDETKKDEKKETAKKAEEPKKEAAQPAAPQEDPIITIRNVITCILSNMPDTPGATGCAVVLMNRATALDAISVDTIHDEMYNICAPDDQQYNGVLNDMKKAVAKYYETGSKDVLTGSDESLNEPLPSKEAVERALDNFTFPEMKQ